MILISTAVCLTNTDTGWHICQPWIMYHRVIEVDRILTSVSAPNVDKWALSVDIWFRRKAVVSHSVHFRFWRAAVGKFGGCRK